jgi:hypothetical protein
VITSSTFQQNDGSAGGALHFINANGLFDLLVEDCDFIDNLASNNYGGAVYHRTYPAANAQSNFIYRDCAFTGNQAYGQGGAAYNQLTDILFDNCLFSDNRAENEPNDASAGGAVANILNANTYAINVEYNRCDFLYNFARANGGAMFNHHDGNGDMTLLVDSCTFVGNYTSGTGSNFGRGGAIRTNGGRGTHMFTNTSFTDNYSTQDGGAMYLYGNTENTLTVNVDSCVFNNNTAPMLGRTIYQYAYANSIITNWSNTTFHSEVDGVYYNRKFPSTPFGQVTFDGTCTIVGPGGSSSLIQSSDLYPYHSERGVRLPDDR